METHSVFCAWRIPKDRGAWQAAVHGVAKSQTQLSDSAHSTYVVHCFRRVDVKGDICVKTVVAMWTKSHIIDFCNKWNFCFVQSPSHVQLLETPWTTAHQASLSLTISWSLPKYIFIALVMMSRHLILWHLFTFCPQSFPASGTFPMSCLFMSDDLNTEASPLASVLAVNIQGWSPLRWAGLISLLSRGLSGVFSNTTVQRYQFFGILSYLQSSYHNYTWPLGKPQPWLYRLLLAK